MKVNNGEIEFVRFGGLSQVNHKKFRKIKNGEYHTPPKNKGIYAFIYPYIENFLWAWKLDASKVLKHRTNENLSLKECERIHTKFFKSEYRRLRKKFKYNGYIWTHFIDIARKYDLGEEYIESWVKVHTNDMKFILKKDRHETVKYGVEVNPNLIINPYKRGLGGFFSKDHLEVFIEKVN